MSILSSIIPVVKTIIHVATALLTFLQVLTKPTVFSF